MHKLLNVLNQKAQQANQHRAITKHGTVTSYDPDTYSVKVQIQPDGNITSWIPLKSAWIGNGWGLFCPPSIGDAVELHFQEGAAGVPSVGMRFFNKVDLPLSCPSGEFWLVHKSGSLLKFHNDGNVELYVDNDLNAIVNNDANITINNDLTSIVKGDASIEVDKTTTIHCKDNVTATIDKNLTATVTQDASLSVTGNLTSSATNWTHTGPLTITGQVTAQSGLEVTGFLESHGSIYTHGNVTAKFDVWDRDADETQGGCSSMAHMRSRYNWHLHPPDLTPPQMTDHM